MKTIIAGSRNITDYNTVLEAVADSGFVISEVVSGTARGVDTLGEQLAREFGFPVIRFPADWDTYGRRAGHIRNRLMAEYADALIAVWDGYSTGTRNMIDTAQLLGLNIYIHIV